MKIERFASLMVTALEKGLPCEINIFGAPYRFQKVHSVTAPEYRWSDRTLSNKPISGFMRTHKGQEFRIFGTLESESGLVTEEVALNLDCEFVCSVLYETVERE